MNNKIEKLTPQQEAQIIPHRDYWLNYILSCKNSTDKERSAKGIEWMYKYCKKEKPVMIFMDSPYGCQVAANFFKQYLESGKDNIWSNIRDNIGSNIWDNIGSNIRDNIWDNIGSNIRSNIRDNIWSNIGSNIRSNIGSNIRDNIRDNIRSNIGSNIRDNIWDNIGSNIRDNIWDNIRSNIGSNIRDNIWDNIGSNIRDNIWDNIRDNNIEYHSTGWRGNISDYGWVAWIDYFFQMDLITSDRKEDFEAFKNLLLSGVFEMIQFEGICIVSDMPNNIVRNDNNQLHSVDAEAVMFKDGYGQHYIHGRYLPNNYFNSIKDKSLTAEVFFTETNEEVKSACISMMQEIYGEEYVFNFFREHLKESDTYVDKKEEKYLNGTTGGMNIGVYTLFKGEINDEDVAFVRCYCPSTDRMFFLGVDPIHTNAKNAIASLYRVPKKLKAHIKYIQRQGERYSTVFDDPGTEMLREKKLTEKDIQDTTTISGHEYFSLIRYEY